MKDPYLDKLKNRYPGIKPFAEEDTQLFFGRKKDLDEFNSLVFVKQTVVLYGKSGYGKSSLINAGIIPELKRNDQWVYFSIRFNNYSEKETVENLSPAQTIKKRFSEKIKENTNSPFYNIIPHEDSFWYWIKQNQLVTNKTKFIIFFDQFEELFTYPKNEIADFSEQLSQLLYGTVPVNFRKRIAELDEDGSFSNELEEFVYKKPEIKVVFSIRSDRLSLINVLTDRHPSILQNCYELNALTVEDAALAIIEPARLEEDNEFKTPPFKYTQPAVDKILKGIANPQDGKIETSTLQIVCRYIEDNLVADKKHVLITEDILGNITDIFQQYYETILNKLSEDERSKAQRLIEDELIDVDRRNSLTTNYIQGKFGLTEKLLSVLEQSSLLRKERDASGRIFYEISHDTLVAAVNKVAEKRRQSEGEAKKLELERLFEEEKLKSENLTKLHAKSVLAFRLAIGMAVIAIIAAVLATRSTINSEKEKEIAEDQAKKANVALYENNLLKAGDLVNRANIFIKSNDLQYARTDLIKADTLIHPQFELPQKIAIEKSRIQHEVDSLLIHCK
ncbi:MAG: ATP-binding protein [Mucilaginibacter sp.]|nr:ATP-binding protein [Mucilaginibacter sp.]